MTGRFLIGQIALTFCTCCVTAGEPPVRAKLTPLPSAQEKSIPKDPAAGATQPDDNKTQPKAVEPKASSGQSKLLRVPPLPSDWKHLTLTPEQQAKAAAIQQKYQAMKDPLLVRSGEIKRQMAERSQELGSKIKAIRQEPSVKMDALRQEIKRVQALIKDATATQQKEMQELQRENQKDSDEAQRKIRALKQNLEQQMEALLTPEQKDRLTELKTIHLPATKKE